MKKKRIAILYGGKSGEHEVSCRSAASVLAHLDDELFDPVCIGVAKNGVWYLQKGGKESLLIEENGRNSVSVVPGMGLYGGEGPLSVDFVFPVLHGTFGEDGTVQGCLELTDLPYAGADTLGSALGMDKERTKQVWLQSGLPVVPFITAKKSSLMKDSAAKGTVKTDSGAKGSVLDPTSVERLYERVTKEFGDLLFIKPVCSGSSVGVNKVYNKEQFTKALEEVFTFDVRTIIEPALAAREIECSVVGNDEVSVYPPGEVVPSHDFYSYNAKYVDENGAKLCIPAALPEKSLEEIKDLAKKAYTAVGAKGFARVDCFIRKEDNKVLLNEINTIPGFTNISMFSRMCEAGGLSYSDLLTRIIQLGFERFDKSRELLYT